MTSASEERWRLSNCFFQSMEQVVVRGGRIRRIGWVIKTMESFVHGQQSRQEIIWIAPKKFQKLLRWLAPLTFLIRIQAFWDPLRGEFPHVQIFINDEPKQLTWNAQFLSYWFSRNPAVFQDWLVKWSIISAVVTALGRLGRRKITAFKLGQPVFDGGIQWCMFP